VYYPLPLHEQPCFSYLKYHSGQFPVAERAAAEVVSLPVFPELTKTQQDEVVEAVRKFYQK
jgi:UDP-2-acetamido-2-deoxy-ribo-hexuluronate aminotransferase